MAVVPIKAPWLWINWIVFDYVRFFKGTDPAIQINWTKYHGFCIILVLLGKKTGADMSEEIRAIKASLRQKTLGFKIAVGLDVVARLGGLVVQVIRNRFRR
jgi:hypothetical protein